MAALCFERMLGTLGGGAVGLAVRFLGEDQPSSSAWAFYGLLAAVVSLLGAQLGTQLPHCEGCDLFIITFLLVFSSGEDMVRDRVLSLLAVNTLKQC